MNNFRTIGRYLLLTIFVLYTTSITLFTHVHVVDGVSIVHSHFYNFWDDNTSEVGILKILINFFRASDIEGAQYSDITHLNSHRLDSTDESDVRGIPSQEHQHSSDQLILFEMLSHFRKVGLPLLFFLVIPLVVYVYNELIDCIRCYVAKPFLVSYSLRGPPISYYFNFQ